MYSREVEES